MKKFLILFGIIILVIVLAFALVFIIWLFDDKDFCLTTGNCAEGLKLNTEYGLIEINKENCLKYNWEWSNGNCNVNKK